MSQSAVVAHGSSELVERSLSAAQANAVGTRLRRRSLRFWPYRLPQGISGCMNASSHHCLPCHRLIRTVSLFDLTPMTVTVTAGRERVVWRTTIHEIRTDWTLWRRMHLADWNAVPEALRREGLDNMLARYRPVLISPSTWDAMRPTDWDQVGRPQPRRAYSADQASGSGIGRYRLRNTPS